MKYEIQNNNIMSFEIKNGINFILETFVKNKLKYVTLVK